MTINKLQLSTYSLNLCIKRHLTVDMTRVKWNAFRIAKRRSHQSATMSSIQSVKRAFEILHAIANSYSDVQLARLASATGLPKPTIVRMLSTLEEIQAVERNPLSGGYRIGPGIAQLVSKPSWLLTICQPVLEEMALVSGEAASLAVLEKDQLRYIAQISSPNSNIQIRDWTGIQVPTLHIASSGKLFLAYHPQLKQRYLEKPLEQFTNHTLITAAALELELSTILENGFAWVRDEFELGLSGVSAPLFDANGTMIAGLNLYGPSFRLPLERGGELVEIVVEFARQVNGELSAVSSKQ